MYDTVIIGAGVSGAAIARELSRYQGKFLVLEKEEDVCAGTSKANSGIVHGGYDATPGTLMAKLNVEGTRRMPQLAEELDFPYENTGSLVLSFSEEGREGLEKLLEQGLENGVAGMSIIEREEIEEIEPNIGDDVCCALLCTSAGIVCPFNLNIALAENAYTNGVEFSLETEVTGIDREDDFYTVHTNKGDFETKTVVNAAGLYSDEIHNMIAKDDDQFEITPRSGEYYLLDKEVGDYVKHTLFQLPTKMGKGVLVTPTVDDNILVGPTSVDREDKENTETTFAGLGEIREKSDRSVEDLPLWKVITTFTGLRAHGPTGDFIIGEVDGAKGFFDCAAIESPGLSSCPAIGVMVSDMVKDYLDLEEDENFNPKRKGIRLTNHMTREEQQELIKEDPRFGQIVCRCEWITEGEIVEAINRPLGARTLDGIKRRTRAGAGRCQAGFCSPKVMEIIARETEGRMEDVTKNNEDSYIIVGKTKTETE